MTGWDALTSTALSPTFTNEPRRLPHWKGSSACNCFLKPRSTSTTPNYWLFFPFQIFPKSRRTVEKYLDQTICPMLALWPARFAMHHLYECNKHRTCKPRTLPPHHAKQLHVRLHRYFSLHLMNWCHRYFSLFLMFTPYTMYKCEEPCPLLLTTKLPFRKDGLKGWGNVVLRDGWRCGRVLPISIHVYVWHEFQKISS